MMLYLIHLKGFLLFIIFPGVVSDAKICSGKNLTKTEGENKINRCIHMYNFLDHNRHKTSKTILNKEQKLNTDTPDENYPVVGKEEFCKQET